MVKTKFEHGETALLGEEEVVISVSQKNFATKLINYQLADGRKVKEEDLTKLKSGIKRNTPAAPIKSVREQYKEALGKNPPSKMAKDEEWMLEEIAKKQAADNPTEDESPYSILSKLNKEQAVALIAEKELDIDAEDYEELSDLILAICDELGVEVPK